MTVSGGCVVGWYPDEGVKGPTNLKPVTCETVIAGLARIIGKMGMGEELEPEEKDTVVALAADLVHAREEALIDALKEHHAIGPVARLIVLPNPSAEGSM